MKITYRFNESSDDSKMDIERGVKKNDFTKDRIHPTNTPEMDLSSGLPEEGYEKGPLRLQNDNPSFEGSSWFYSNNFNDEETNKRPLHPEPDYLNPEDFHTGDDHVEIHGVEHPTKKVPYEKNDNTDSENYDVYGDIDIDKRNANHLVKENKEKGKIKHIYKENKNIMKNTMQEQVDRIKQMILFEDGMSYNDVKSLTEQPEGKETVAAVSAEKGAPLGDGDTFTVTDDTVSGLKSKESGGEKVDSVSALEKSPTAQASVKEKGDDIDMTSPIQSIDSQIQNLTKSIESLKSSLSTAEKAGDDKKINSVKDEIQKNEDELTKLQNQKDTEKKEPVEEPKEDPKEDPEAPVNRTVGMPLNESAEIEGIEMLPNGFWNSINFVLGPGSFQLRTVETPSGNVLGNDDYNLTVNYYSLIDVSSEGPGSGKLTPRSGLDGYATSDGEFTLGAVDAEKGEPTSSLGTLISTKSGEDSEIFVTAMEKIGVTFNTMSVPAGVPASPANPTWATASSQASAFQPQPAQAKPSSSELEKSFTQQQQVSVTNIENPIKGISQSGVVVYSFANQESFDNAIAAGPNGQNAAIAAEVQNVKGPGGPGGPGRPGDFVDGFVTATGNGYNYELNFGKAGFQPQDVKSFQGLTGKVSEKKDGTLSINFGKLEHPKIGLVELFGEDEGSGEFFDMSTRDEKGEVRRLAKVPFTLSKVANVSSPTTKFKSSTARGSYSSPMASRGGFSSQRGGLKFGTSKAEYNPFGGSDTGKYSNNSKDLSKGFRGNVKDMSKAELVKLISQLDKDNEKEELNESRKNVIKLTEGDLYKIVDKVLKEKK